MIYVWCIECASRICVLEGSHRAQKFHTYRADFMLGGRYGKRIRKLFSNKKDAESYEYVTLADFKRGTFLPQSESKIIFNEFFVKYKENYVIRYMRGAETEVYRLNSFVKMFGHRPIHTFKLIDWNLYITERQGISATTLNRDLTSIKVMFKWAVTNGFLKDNPFKEAKKFKVENVRVRWLDDKEIDSVLTACTTAGDLDLRDILVVALNTGFRKANLENLTARDIVGQKVQATKTKSGKVYDVPINSQLANVLSRLANKSGPLLNFENFRRRFDAVIKDPTVTLHTFRHTFAAQCLKRGIPIDRVCAWLGHHSMEFTRSHYGHLCPNQEQVEINLLNLGQKIYSPTFPILGERVREVGDTFS